MVNRSRSARLARHLLVALALASTATSGWAGEGRFGGRGARAQAMRAAGANRMPRSEREAAPREAMERRAPPEEPPPPAMSRPGRLTPDERRALRQQINDAGRDIYRAPRP